MVGTPGSSRRGRGGQVVALRRSKPMPASSMQRATPVGSGRDHDAERPSTSADPHCDVTARLPCLRHLAPAPATTSAAIVETLTGACSVATRPTRVDRRASPGTSARSRSYNKRGPAETPASLFWRCLPFGRSPTRKAGDRVGGLALRGSQRAPPRGRLGRSSRRSSRPDVGPQVAAIAPAIHAPASDRTAPRQDRGDRLDASRRRGQRSAQEQLGMACTSCGGTPVGAVAGALRAVMPCRRPSPRRDRRLSRHDSTTGQTSQDT